MSILDDLFQSLTGAGGPIPSSMQGAGAVDPGQSTAPGGQTSTPLSELIVRGRAPQVSGGSSGVSSAAMPSANLQTPQSPTMAGPPPSVSPQMPSMGDQSDQTPLYNYNNKNSVDAVTAANTADAPQGGSANPGLYGLLPQSLQHGVLRNALGALGDAFLVQGGGSPEYANHLGRQQIGNAMAGMDVNDPASVAAAAQRVAATGASGAAEMSDKLQQQAEQVALRKQYMQYNQDYRTQVLGNQQERIQSQQAAVADRYRPQIGGMLAGIKDAGTYATKYNSLSALAHQLGGPDATPASVWSLPEPGAWTPELTAGYGQTAGQQLQSTDRGLQRKQSQVNAQIGAGSRVKSAGITAGGHVAAAQVSANRPDEATFQDQYIAAKKNGQATTPEQDARFAHDTQVRGGRGLPPGLTPGGGHAPPAAAVGMLRANPGLRSAFDAKYGAGASARVLGH